MEKSKKGKKREIIILTHMPIPVSLSGNCHKKRGNNNAPPKTGNN